MKRVAYEDRRYTVHSRGNSPESVPAGRYEDIDDAIAHSETVTYDMYVWDRESGTAAYKNWEVR